MTKKLTFVNPYEKYGEIHNEGLDFIFGNLSSKYFPTINSKEKEGKLPNVGIKEIIDQTCLYLSYTLCNCSSSFTQRSAFEMEGNYREAQLFEFLAKSFNEKGDIEVLCKKLGLSESSVVHLKYLFNSTLNHENKDTIKLTFDTLEENIFHSNVSDQEKQYLLFTLAISKASANYNQDWNKIIKPFRGTSGNGLGRGIILTEFVSKYNPELKIENENSKKAWYERWSWQKDGKGALKGLIGDSKDSIVDRVKDVLNSTTSVSVIAASSGIGGLFGVGAGLLIGSVGSAIVDSAVDAFNLE